MVGPWIGHSFVMLSRNSSSFLSISSTTATQIHDRRNSKLEKNCPRSTIEVRPTVLLGSHAYTRLTLTIKLDLCLTYDLDLQSQASYDHDPPTHKLKFKRQSVQKIGVEKRTDKLTDTRTDRRTLPVALTFRLTRSVICGEINKCAS